MRFHSFLSTILCLLLTGCAGKTCRQPAVNLSLTPSSVTATGEHEGDLVQWGGVLVEARNLKRSTELEVVGYPLNNCGRPLIGSGQTGRFIIVHPGFLETADYQAGQRVSTTGRITGIRKGQLGDANYSFPLLESYKVRQWPDERAGGDSPRPWFNIGIGGGSGGVYGGVGGGVGVTF